MYNPYIQGWLNYYGNFYQTQLRPTLKRIDLYVTRCARRKFKRLRHQTKGARDWFARLLRAIPALRKAMSAINDNYLNPRSRRRPQSCMTKTPNVTRAIRV
jgi:hypothetical protein